MKHKLKMPSREAKKDLSYSSTDASDLPEPESNVDPESALDAGNTVAQKAPLASESGNRPVAEGTIISEEALEASRSTLSEEHPEYDDDFPEDSTAKDSERMSDDASATKAAKSRCLSAMFCQVKKYRRAVGGVIIGICMLLLAHGIRGLATRERRDDQKNTPVAVYRAPAALDVLSFTKFLVLLGEEDDKAFLLVSISAKPSNTSVYKEANEKKTLCRGAIYEALKQAIKSGTKKMFSKKKLAQEILDALNGILVTGTIGRIDFAEFSIV